MKGIYGIILTLVLSVGLISCADQKASSNNIKEDNEVSSEVNNEIISNKEDKVDDYKKVSDTTKEDSSKNLKEKSNEYELVSKNYNKNNVKINYPEIKKFNDDEKLKSINKYLKGCALKVLDDYVKEDPNLEAVNLNVNYDVKFKNEKYISIVYKGEVNVKGTAYPSSIFYTTNVDLESGNIIRLSDYSNVNDILNKLKDPKNIKVIAENDELAAAQKEFILNIGNDNLINMVKNADFHEVNTKIESPKDGVYSYFDKDGIVISLQVNHAIGDHAEFKLKA
ncbi:DUF4163 domain-containing protein [Clostridium botulinum]|uniref:DUF4163 domain-containing protein n=1 Tax=Clostridium botulinum TaxID=1491 RepID=UPI001C9B5F03|nr:DUF4163 domain-containing protein [Clostridium botulinum]MBY6809283.1 DUF4163 domain-containing protein [Clostridium botulinum]MBY6822725.1 DUF4163 domain-containing protein [Clostridium botulinum]MBY6833337.1 DUF4163 domain-containing protein [Clostridium botulinum]MBY6971398.1 DUF4163 domain-containing protein [Clostridium botulinum]MCS6102735.1 DUF4163 domain-containing protein [Clostridium botulinum]